MNTSHAHCTARRWERNGQWFSGATGNELVLQHLQVLVRKKVDEHWIWLLQDSWPQHLHKHSKRLEIACLACDFFDICKEKGGGLESVLLVQGVQEFGVHSVEELNVTCCRLHRSLENHGQEAHCNWEFFFKIVPIFAQTCDCNNNTEAN